MAEEPAIADLVAARRESAAKLLARAFRDNPLNCAVISGGSARREHCNWLGMRCSLAASFGHATILTADQGGEGLEGAGQDGARLLGVLISAPPYRYPLPRAPLLAQLRSLLGQGFEVQRRWSQVYQRMSDIHPIEPHWYLSVLGVEPDFQGRGVGQALLSHWLQRVDATREPSYLETDRRESARFYERAGFDVVEELRIFDVDIQCMRRPGR